MDTNTDENAQKSVYKDPQVQKELNTPLEDPSGVSDDNADFLHLFVQLIENHKIDLHRPATLLNSAVYDKLNDEKKGKADYEAVNLLADLREIKDLYDAGYKDTYQMNYLLERVRNTKERIEDERGDIFVI